MSTGIVTGRDDVHRCWWGAEPEVYQAYHDHEWGRPVVDDFRLFEKLGLEGFQCGLSWLTILRKREHFRSAFLGFDFHQVACFDERDVERLLTDAGIVRHRGKIEATIRNAGRAVELASEFGSLAAYCWGWEPPATGRPTRIDKQTLSSMGKTPVSVAMSKDFRRRGWSYVGPTTCYAFMQAVGLVNDHLEGCTVRSEVEQMRQDFVRPACPGHPASGVLTRER